MVKIVKCKSKSEARRIIQQLDGKVDRQLAEDAVAKELETGESAPAPKGVGEARWEAMKSAVILLTKGANNASNSN